MLVAHRSDCYSSAYFKACIEALTLKDDMRIYLDMAESLG